MDAVTVRRAVAGDAAAIATIYNQGIEDRVATLETELAPSGARGRARGTRHSLRESQPVQSAAGVRPRRRPVDLRRAERAGPGRGTRAAAPGDRRGAQDRVPQDGPRGVSDERAGD